MAYTKTYVNWNVEIKNLDFWQVVKIRLSVDDLIRKIKDWDIEANSGWYVSIDALPQKPEKIRAWEWTHYLVCSKYVKSDPADSPY
jgi:hypothetical protein